MQKGRFREIAMSVIRFSAAALVLAGLAVTAQAEDVTGKLLIVADARIEPVPAGVARSVALADEFEVTTVSTATVGAPLVDIDEAEAAAAVESMSPAVVPLPTRKPSTVTAPPVRRAVAPRQVRRAEIRVASNEDDSARKRRLSRPVLIGVYR
jgi:hypothetical protein